MGSSPIPPATPTQNDVVNKDSQPPYAPAASDAVCVPRSTPSLAKKKRIRFTEAWDLLLLKAVTASDAHVAPHGKTGKRFEQALKLFLDAAPSSQLVDITRPVPKTLRDRFTTVVEKRRVEVRGTAAASGIVEKRGQREELLDDVILAMDEEQERKNALINERTEKEKQLNDAGEAIRAKAVTRMRKQPREDREEDCRASDSDKSTPVAFKKVRKRVFSTDSDDDEKDAIQEEIKLRQELDVKRLKLEESRFEHDVKRWTEMQAREASRDAKDERRLVMEEKRLALDERKCELDKDERRMAMKERQSLINVLSALADKLK